MSDKLYTLFLTKEEVGYLTALFVNLGETIEKMDDLKFKNLNLKYMNSILGKLDKCRK